MKLNRCANKSRGLLGALAAGLLLISSTFALPASAATWRNGTVSFKNNAGIVDMGSAMDYGKAYGLKVDNVQFLGDPIALKALISGDVDSYEGNPAAPLTAVAHGADLHTVGCYFPRLSYILYGLKSLKSPADVRGKVIAISNPGSLPAMVTQLILEKYGVPMKDVRQVMVGNDADRVRAVLSGQVAVGAAGAGFIPLVEKQGGHALADIYDVAPLYPRFCLYVTGKTLRSAEKRDQLVKFLAVKMQGVRYALAHRDATIALTEKLIGADHSAGAAFSFDHNVKLNTVDWRIGPHVDRLNWLNEQLVKFGRIEKPVDISKFLVRQPVEDAMKLYLKTVPQEPSAK
ncbi:MAG: ABC transporter substrate-binding protein [Burkholderiaceae bacterium]|nr:MAG: ABC transporter substrate-binding protein [Burkholderiaceae bacterium]